MISEIYNKVVDIMNELSGTGQVLSIVYGYPEAEPLQFPCALMDLSTGIKQEDIASNEKIMTVNIIIRVLMRQKNTEDATLKRITIMDAVINKFTTANIIDDLDGVADMMDISAIEPMFVAGTSDQPLFGFDITISAKKTMAAI